MLEPTRREFRGGAPRGVALCPTRWAPTRNSRREGGNIVEEAPTRRSDEIGGVLWFVLRRGGHYGEIINKALVSSKSFDTTSYYSILDDDISMNEVVGRPMADGVGHCRVIFHIVGEVKFENSTRWKRRTNYGFWPTESTYAVFDRNEVQFPK